MTTFDSNLTHQFQVPKDISGDVGRRAKEARLARGLRQADVATAVGISR